MAQTNQAFADINTMQCSSNELYAGDKYKKSAYCVVGKGGIVFLLLLGVIMAVAAGLLAHFFTKSNCSEKLSSWKDIHNFCTAEASQRGECMLTWVIHYFYRKLLLF